VGGRVSALVGELGCWNGKVDENGKKMNHFKERLFGTVAESKSDRNWLVRWDWRDVAGEEEHATFKLKHEGPGADLRPKNQEAAVVARQEWLAQQAGVGVPPITNTVQASTAVVLQATTAPPQETTTMATTTTLMITTPAPTPTQEQPKQALVPPAVDTVEEETIAQAAVEDADARTVDPDVLEKQDDRFNVANDFESYNLDDIAEYDGD
jgi:hypothetical protein